MSGGLCALKRNVPHVSQKLALLIARPEGFCHPLFEPSRVGYKLYKRLLYGLGVP